MSVIDMCNRRVWRTHRHCQRHHSEPVIPGAVSVEQELCLADPCSSSVPHHCQLHALWPWRQQCEYSLPSSFSIHLFIHYLFFHPFIFEDFSDIRTYIGSLYLSLKPTFETLVWNQKPVSNRS